MPKAARSDKGSKHVRSYKSRLPPHGDVKVDNRQIKLKLPKVRTDPKHCRKNAGEPHELQCIASSRYDLSVQKDWRVLICNKCGWEAGHYTPVLHRSETLHRPPWVTTSPKIKSVVVEEKVELAVG